MQDSIIEFAIGGSMDKQKHISEYEQMLDRAEREWKRKIRQYLRERKFNKQKENEVKECQVKPE